MSKNKQFVDLVIGGPDMSGTSTQIGDAIDYFQEKSMTVRDLRGNEMEVLFHAKEFDKFNKDLLGLSEFLDNTNEKDKNEFFSQSAELLFGRNLKVASCVENSATSYIDPLSADVWIMEEPTKRGAGQVNRVIEQNMSQFGDRKMTPVDAAHCHAVYRKDEFLRFREAFRKNGLITVRSRSEETSICYQLKDDKLPDGIEIDDYLKLPGHGFAFGNAPTHIFVVHAPENWTKEEYIDLKKTRSNGRELDDYEINVDYQLLLNRRYATSWLEEVYEKGCAIHGGTVPKIYRFNLYDSKEEIKKQMSAAWDEILQNR